MSMAADGLRGRGREATEAELVLYTLPRNPYDPPCSVVPLSFGKEKLSGHFELANLTVTILGRTAGRGIAMARIISVANQKGGVGKTTSAINIAAGLAKSGRSALVVDIDPQCNATSGLGVEPAQRHPLLAGKALAESVVETSQPRLFVLPGSQSLADADALSASNRQRASTLRQQLASELSHFHYIFLDCPPSIGQLTRAALGASGEIYIPIQCEYFAMEGLSQIIELARQTKARENHRLEIGGIVLTMYDPSLELANEVASEVRQYFDETVFETLIPRDVSISEAPSHGLSVLDYAPRARGARAYTELVMEVIDRE
jgi:chromosome partitioning protein